MSFAEAINAAMEETIEQLQDYGRLLAQAGIPLDEAAITHGFNHVAAGYYEQLEDYPFG
jgi:hypothetical protein